MHQRSPLKQRLNAWRKRSPFNAYWLDRLHLRRSVEALAPHASGVLLDVGVAERPYAEMFAPHVERYLGLEYPPTVLDKQPALWRMLDVMKRFIDVFGDGNRLPFADASLDTVLCTEVLEHVREPDRFVAEMARVLKPGGRLLLTVPFIQPLHELPSDYYRYTSASVAALIERNGLETELVEPRGNSASAVGATLAQFLLRALAARETLSDGSVVPSLWRMVLLMPVLAVVQVTFHLVSKLARDGSMPLGWRAVARKPAAG
ncbi:MAG: class I SAM-dependent methyltransferase [Planctomycetota bacterium]|nr:class I SAM-dependent methyltransferase [Planctomycetota bacterium]